MMLLKEAFYCLPVTLVNSSGNSSGHDHCGLSDPGVMLVAEKIVHFLFNNIKKICQDWLWGCR